MSHSFQAMLKGMQRARLAGSNLRGDREKDDFYATPPSATKALLQVESFDGAIWEPACGDGAISKVLESAGHQVVSTDLVDRGYGTARIDFLMETRALAPKIITNPPFKLGTDFVLRALALTTGKIAMLLKVGFLEGLDRARVYDEQPFARLWVFRARQTFLRGGSEAIQMNGDGGMIAYGWFVWDRTHAGPPTLGWI